MTGVNDTQVWDHSDEPENIPVDHEYGDKARAMYKRFVAVYEPRDSIRQEEIRALRDHDYESLEILINRRLYQGNVPIHASDQIAAIVHKIAPGWEYVDVTALQDNRPRIALTQYTGH